VALYDTIGRGYTRTRVPDARIAAQIEVALGGARTVLNVGAGTGSYEPAGRRVVAVEPSRVMIAQRPADAAPVVRAFADCAFDVAMAILSDHHWSDREAGLRELRRVAHRAVVLQWDPASCWDFWLTRDYLPGFAGVVAPEQVITIARIAQLLGGADTETVPVPADCSDGFYGAFWRRPEAYLDPEVRNGISVFARLDPNEVDQGMSALTADLASGRWAARNMALLAATELDLGYRLIVAGESR
jgi:SAM-dependent methyltransferase